MQGNKENLIVELTFNFALKIIRCAEQLEKQKKFVLANQLLKSGTGIGANVREAQNAESKIDFIHKMKLLQRELMKLNIGFCFASIRKITRNAMICFPTAHLSSGFFPKSSHPPKFLTIIINQFPNLQISKSI